MRQKNKRAIDFGNDDVMKILLRLAPPVMIAQLIQALYNIIDSFFIGRNSEDGLTALSIIYPIQLLMIALAVGTVVGINTLMAYYQGIKKHKESEEVAGVATFLALVMWAAFAIICYFGMPFYAKILQAIGNMKLPMIAQIAGAIVNIVLDPILIFGVGIIPAMGIGGAAIATVSGQIVAALIVMTKGYRKSPAFSKYFAYVKRIYYLGFPNILMQSAYTLYIFGLNLILKEFSDQAVTVLGLYYKWQTFFFIPLGSMQTCIVPVLSFNYGAGMYSRCKKTLKDSILFGMALMLLGVLCFELIPAQMLGVFSRDAKVIDIGVNAFRIIGVSFIPLVTSLIYPVYFQAIGYAGRSSALTVLRTVALFVPLAWIFSRFGLEYFWLTYPMTEIITTTVGYIMYKRFNRRYEKMLR